MVIVLNDNDYYKWVNEINKQYYEKHKYDKIIKYLKDNHLAIIDLFLSIVAIVISIIALANS